MVLLAMVLGLVLGASAVGLTWFVHGRTMFAGQFPATDASTDAAAACATLARVPPLSSPDFETPSPEGVSSGVFRLAGAASLAQAAEAEDAHYKALSDALDRANQMVAGAGDGASDEELAALADARAACVNH
jgi:hypothetical protein